MERIYYPETNTFLIKYGGRLFGASGRIAERIFARCLQNDIPVSIGAKPVSHMVRSRSGSISKN